MATGVCATGVGLFYHGTGPPCTQFFCCAPPFMPHSIQFIRLHPTTAQHAGALVKYTGLPWGNGQYVASLMVAVCGLLPLCLANR